MQRPLPNKECDVFFCDTEDEKFSSWHFYESPTSIDFCVFTLWSIVTKLPKLIASETRKLLFSQTLQRRFNLISLYCSHVWMCTILGLETNYGIFFKIQKYTMTFDCIRDDVSYFLYSDCEQSDFRDRFFLMKNLQSN